MTTTQLIEVLKTYPPNAEVVAEWDNGWSHIRDHTLKKDKCGRDIVEFDVSEFGSYRDDS